MLKRIWAGLVWLVREFIAAARDVIRLPFWLIGLGFRSLAAEGWKRLALLGAAALIVTVIATTLLIQATSQPGFCKSCHVMQPYFEAWQTSHHNQVQCVKCHVPPGIKGTLKHKFMALSMVANYFTGVYKRSKPWAEVEDTACLQGGCHETRLLKGKVDFKGVVFDHTPHLTQPRRERQLRCTSCHAQIVQGEHITVTETTCFLCHFKPDSAGKATDLARCTHCHRPPTGPAAADSSFDHTRVLDRQIACQNCHAGAVVGDGFVPRERCNTCHAKLEHIQRYNDLAFVHKTHVTEHKVECTNCHIAIRHGKQVRTASDDPASTCADCHAAEAAVWRGELPGLAKTPSRMARVGMSCSSCHTEPLHKAGVKNPPPVCTPCHEGGYDELWPRWQAPLVRTVDGMIADAKRLPGADGATLQQALALYRQGNPAHDPDLILALRAKLGGAPAQAPNACASCHPAAAEASPVWSGIPVPHRTHAQAGLTCDQCHDTESADHHGRLKITGVDCNACHHKTVASGAACATCHSYQQQVFTGKLPVPNAVPSPMAVAEVACTDCHTSERGLVRRDDVKACIGCHDATFADTLRLWQRDGDALAARIEARMNTLNRTSDAYRRYQELQAALKRDGSRGAHSPALFKEWMQRLETTP